uniref:Caspase family p20 domain-containing protein n=1 Tax=Anopheles epiroticus TaxID=199890 RepID=A0A240PLY8_9DIPT
MDSPPKLEIEKYNTNNPKRGIAVILHDTNNRKGTEKDLKRLIGVLSALKFVVRVITDKTVTEIRTALELVSKEDHSDNDCLVIVAMCHGSKDTLIFDGRELHIKELWENFVGNRCPSLFDKPKLVFVQSCRGEKFDSGSKLETDSAPNLVDPVSVLIPMYAHLLVMYSCYEDYVSYRSEEEGTWFIQALCNVLRSDIENENLLTLLTHVSNLVANRSAETASGSFKQIPVINSMLTKQFYFVPK